MKYHGITLIILPFIPGKEPFAILKEKDFPSKNKTRYLSFSDYPSYSNVDRALEKYYIDYEMRKQCNIVSYDGKYLIVMKFVKWAYLSEDDLMVKEIIE